MLLLEAKQPMAMEAEALVFHRKRRGVVRMSLTKLRTKLTDFEVDTTIPTLRESSKNLADKLNTLHQDYKNHQLSIIDRTNDEEDLAEEQQNLDDADDQFFELSVRVHRLMTLAVPSMSPDVARMATRQLQLLNTKLESIDASVHGLSDDEDNIVCTLEEYRDQVSEIKAELSTISTSLLSSDVPTDDLVMQTQVRTDKSVFDCLLKVKKQLRVLIVNSTKPNEHTATKLPKLELPTLHGDILSWQNF